MIHRGARPGGCTLARERVRSVEDVSVLREGLSLWKASSDECSEGRFVDLSVLKEGWSLWKTSEF